VNPNSNPKVTPTALDVARPLAGNMDQAVIEAAAGMGAVVTELMRRSLRGGVLTVGEQLGSYVGECVDLTIRERRPVIEQTAASVAEQTAYATAAKVVGEEVYALEQRTTEATRGLAGQIEEKAQRLSAEIEEKRQQLTTRMDEGHQHAVQVTHEKARELTGQIEQTAKHVSEAAQAEIGLRVQELMDKAREGSVLLKARIRAVADVTTELGQRLDAERQAREAERAAVRDLKRSLIDELRELRRTNDKLSARVAELERPRGLRRLWLWLAGRFRRGQAPNTSPEGSQAVSE
jgi:hypothetical protein